MVKIGTRMRALKTRILGIRIGPGAVVFPKNVVKINMAFPDNIMMGNRGAKLFMRRIIPRMKFRNPHLPVSIFRPKAWDPSNPAHLTVWMRNPTESNPQHFDKHDIDMKHKEDVEIMEELAKLTKAQRVEPSEVELAELQELEEQKERGQVARDRMIEVNRQRKRELMILRQAKGELGATT